MNPNSAYVNQLRHMFYRLQEVPQNKKWHPEGNVFKHTAIVAERASAATTYEVNSETFIAAAYFHDVAKFDQLAYNTNTGEPTAYGHETVGLKYFDACVADLFPEADLILARMLVAQHMRIKLYNAMSPKKQAAFKREIGDNWDHLVLFNSFDDMSTLPPNLEEYTEQCVQWFEADLQNRLSLLGAGVGVWPFNLYLIRGVSGSGKTTFARALTNAVMYAADDYFYDAYKKTYTFDKTKIGEAHAQCLEKTRIALNQGKDVAVHNTFTQLWEMFPYFKLAHDLGINVTSVIVENINNRDSTHGVPAQQTNLQRNRFQINL